MTFKSITVACLLPAVILLSSPVNAQYEFSVDEELDCTSIKSQGRTGTCWSFATISFLESEASREGSTAVDLSEMYIVRKNYLDKARNYLLRQGKANFSEGSLSHDVTRIINRYGVMPESAYPGKAEDASMHDHSELVKIMKGALDGFLSSKPISDKWPDVINGILDVYLGELPADFTVNGASMTPVEYSQELGFEATEYMSLTSFTHHPFYQPFVLEIPDNYSNGSYQNVTIDELMAVIDNSVAKGWTVAWDGDVSEKGFKAKQSIAVLPVDPAREDLFETPGEEVEVTQKTRQVEFEALRTTDDHLMHITGIAYDQNGTKYYVVKNSWGEIGPKKGFVYMSEPYMRMKTVAVMVHQDAIPDRISNKFNTAITN